MSTSPGAHASSRVVVPDSLTGPSLTGPGLTGPGLTGPGLGTLSVVSLLADTARRSPDRTAVTCHGVSVTYRDLWAQTRAYAGALRRRGIGPGDRVAVVVPNVPDFPRAYFAVLALGAVVVPVHLLLTAEEVEHVLRDSGARLVVVAAPVLSAVLPAAAAAGVDAVTVLVPDELRERVPVPRLEDEADRAEPLLTHVSVDPSAPATVLYTSGTTGRPKGAVGSHLAIVEQVHTNLLDSYDLRAGDVVFGGLPLFHTFGQVCVMNTAFRRGATVLLLPRFDAREALALMVEHGASVFMGVPTMYVALLQAAPEAPALPSLRYGISGGSSLPVAVLEAFEEVFGAPVHEGYGLTETSPVVSFNPVGEPTRPGSVGQPIWGVDVEVADAAVEERIDLLPRGQLGEVVVRGHNLFKGYLGQPEATAAAVVDGWFRTGDLGTMDDDDVITIVDRKKDMIVRNGYNVYCSEVEEVLARCPGLASVAVFGVSDPVRGQEVHAAVVPVAGVRVDPGEVIAFAREHVASYKYPRRVHVLEALPTGPSGKVLKRELVARFDVPPSAG